jgi:hypothetical protein
MGDYFVSTTIRVRISNVRFEVITVYGPADHWSLFFLKELHDKCWGLLLPAVIGGDFNLIRGVEDKSLGMGYTRLIEGFNAFIEGHDLREIHRKMGQDSPGQISKVNISKAILTDFWRQRIGSLNIHHAA